MSQSITSRRETTRPSALLGALFGIVAISLLLLTACGDRDPASAADHQPEDTPDVGSTPRIEHGPLGQAGSGEAVPQHLAPEPGATVSDRQPTLRWSDVSGADRYEVQVSSVARYSPETTEASVTVEGWEWSPPVAFAPGDTYYWRARALFRTDEVGRWSDYSPFEVPVSATTPPDPAGTPPSMGTTVAPGTTEAPRGHSGSLTLSHGGVVTELSIWQAGGGENMTEPGRSVAEVLRALEPGKQYFFLASDDVVLRPADFGVDHHPIHLEGDRELLKTWSPH